jgi:hypothetical protein
MYLKKNFFKKTKLSASKVTFNWSTNQRSTNQQTIKQKQNNVRKHVFLFFLKHPFFLSACVERKNLREREDQKFKKS